MVHTERAVVAMRRLTQVRRPVIVFAIAVMACTTGFAVGGGNGSGALMLDPVSGIGSLAPGECPSGFQNIRFVPENVAALATDLDQLTACTDDVHQQGYVRNDADEVWILDSPPGLQWLVAAPTPSAEIFRQSMGLLVRDGHIPPPAGLPVEPGVATTFSLDTTIPLHITLDANVQAIWHTDQAVAGKAIEKGQEYAVKLMSQNSKSRGAVLNCALQGYRLGKKVGDDPALDLKLALGVTTNVTSCGKSMLAAEQEAAEFGDAAIRRAEVGGFVESETWAAPVRRAIKAALTGLRAAVRAH
jgi:hypothetical protein